MLCIAHAKLSNGNILYYRFKQLYHVMYILLLTKHGLTNVDNYYKKAFPLSKKLHLLNLLCMKLE